MTKFFALFCVIIFCAAAAFGQPPPAAEWTRIEDDKAKVSILFPADFLVDNEPEKYVFTAPSRLTRYSEPIDAVEKPKIMAHRKSAVLMLRIHRLKNYVAKDYLWQYVGSEPPKTKYQDFKIGEVTGRAIFRDTESRVSIYIAFAFKDRVFTVSAAAKNEDAAIYQKFVKSLTIDGSPLFKAEPPAADSSASVALESLSTSAEILTALNQQPEKSNANVVEGSPIVVNEKPAERKFSRPLILLREPPPAFHSVALSRGQSGVVRLNVTFLATGKIGKIEIISKMPDGLTAATVKATQNIKFLPAEIDGKPVDETRAIEYGFDFR